MHVFLNTIKIDYRKLITLEHILKNGPAFTLGGIREWLSKRHQNGLIHVLVQIDNNLFFDEFSWNVWLSQDKDEVSDYRDLRTRKQILERSSLKESKLDDWLRKRQFNGLHVAVIKKGPRRLYIDIKLFNRWLSSRNKNSEFARTPDIA